MTGPDHYSKSSAWKDYIECECECKLSLSVKGQLSAISKQLAAHEEVYSQGAAIGDAVGSHLLTKEKQGDKRVLTYALFYRQKKQ